MRAAAKRSTAPTALIVALAVALAGCRPEGDGDTPLFPGLPRTIAQTVTEGGPNPASQSVVLTNTGNCGLFFTATPTTTDGKPWLVVSPASGTVPPNQSQTLTLSIDVVTTSLRPGTYTGGVTLSGSCSVTSQVAQGNGSVIAVNVVVTRIGAAISLDRGSITQDVPTLTNTWSATSLAEAPSARQRATAVWTGYNMLVWGGAGDGGSTPPQGTGASYDPSTNTWTEISAQGAPSARYYHTALWTGSKMIIWGGRDDAGPTNTGALYDPQTDTWQPMSTAGAVPSAREFHSAVWAGTEMIVFGGLTASGRTDTGAYYSPTTNSWTLSTSTLGAPAGRAFHSAVWTGSRMIVWGGVDVAGDPVASGGIFNPVANGWVATTATTNAPSARTGHGALWTGSRMFIWGGFDTAVTATGALYNPGTNGWTTIAATGAPSARSAFRPVWTGTQVIVWAGSPATAGAGAVYDPAANAWSPVLNAGEPVGRREYAAVWTGSKMITWGGLDAGSLATSSGGIYQ